MVERILIFGNKKNKFHFYTILITLDYLDDLNDLPVEVSEKTDYFEINYN